MKSHYVALQSGKDPGIEVTEVGLAFLAAVRRVFPSYGDPVGRAMFEAELSEIGRAPSRSEAMRRADAFRQRTRGRVDDLIGAISGSAMLDVDPGTRPASGSKGDARPPTAAMVAYAVALAEQKGLKLPRGLKGDSRICRTFLGEQAEPRVPHGRETVDDAGARQPTAAMVRYAEKLSRELGIPLTTAVKGNFPACRAFLDAHARGRSSGNDGTKAVVKRRGARQAPIGGRPS